MMPIFKARNTLAAAGLFLCALAGTANAGDARQTVVDAIHSVVPKASIDSVEKSELPGYYVVITGGQPVYVSEDGKYLLQGSLYDLVNKKDLTAEHMSQLRETALDKVGEDQRIVFAPDHPKYAVTVFTDPECPFCRRFHAQIKDYMAQGIKVKYVFFPLDIHPGADRKSVAIWCAKDRHSTFTSALSGADPGQATCKNPIADDLALGKRIGIRATPTAIAADGTQVPPGIAMSPPKLAAFLGQHPASGDSMAAR